MHDRSSNIHAVFDRDGAMTRIDNDTALLAELVDICVGEYDGFRAKAEHAARTDDSKAIEVAAHSMKSAFGNVGAMRCFEVCSVLERAGRDRETERFEALLTSLVAEFEQFKTAYAAFTATLNR